MRRPVLLLGLTLAIALALSACGGSSSSTPTRANLPSASLVLDFAPNAVHTGIYEALGRHDDVRAGVHLHVIVPGATTDSIRLLETGRVNFAILDIHDLAIARERGENIVGIMAIEQRPLASVIAAPSVSSPRALAGRMVGITGVPSDTAVLDSIVAGAGGEPKRVHTITIGYDAVADLLAGRVAAATAFWNDEGVTIRRRRPGFHIFRVDAYGAPSYPELVVCATAASLKADPALARAVLRALRTGYQQVLADPAAGLHSLTTLVPGLDVPLQKAELAGLLPAFDQPGGRVGYLDPTRLRIWARWEQRFGIITRRLPVSSMFSDQYLPAG
jgi:putative hydroxymethylpyrimidine transport system substrate-binding protein